MSKNTRITVFAKDNDRPGNRDVVAFLKQHLPTLVKAGIVFEFKIANEKMDKALISRNITKLPAIEVESRKGVVSFQTPVEIKSALLKFMNSTGQTTVRKKRIPEDELDEFYKSEMTFEKAEEDNEQDDDKSSSMMDKYQREVERRQKEDDKRGPKKPQKGGSRRRPANVAEDDDPPRRQHDDLDISTRRRDPPPQTPQDRLRAAGGDPGSKDDLLIMQMMEESDI